MITGKMKILVVDDHAIMRDGIGALLVLQDDVESLAIDDFQKENQVLLVKIDYLNNIRMIELSQADGFVLETSPDILIHDKFFFNFFCGHFSFQ